MYVFVCAGVHVCLHSDSGGGVQRCAGYVRAATATAAAAATAADTLPCTTDDSDCSALPVMVFPMLCDVVTLCENAYCRRAEVYSTMRHHTDDSVAG